MDKFVNLSAGDPAPVFTARSNVNPAFRFDTVAGRYVLLAFLGTISDPVSLAAIDFVKRHPDYFDDERLAFFGVVLGAGTQTEEVLNASDLRLFFDDDGEISREFGSLPVERTSAATVPFIRKWVLLDPMLRVVAVVPMMPDAADLRELGTLITSLPPVERFAGFEIQAPVLLLPNVLSTTSASGSSAFTKLTAERSPASCERWPEKRSPLMIIDTSAGLTIRSTIRNSSDCCRRASVGELFRKFRKRTSSKSRAWSVTLSVVTMRETADISARTVTIRPVVRHTDASRFRSISMAISMGAQ